MNKTHNLPKADICVVTVVLNGQDTISKCIESVSQQNFANYIHLIIDGGSNDNTVNIIKSKIHSKLKLRVENDNGMYDAMNKCLKIIDANYYLFLNSDDYLYKKDILSIASKVSSINKALIVGQIVHGFDGNIFKKWVHPLSKNHFLLITRPILLLLYKNVISKEFSTGPTLNMPVIIGFGKI